MEHGTLLVLLSPRGWSATFRGKRAEKKPTGGFSRHEMEGRPAVRRKPSPEHKRYDEPINPRTFIVEISGQMLGPV